eukprot:5155940-Prymnesium_polylepis.1
MVLMCRRLLPEANSDIYLQGAASFTPPRGREWRSCTDQGLLQPAQYWGCRARRRDYGRLASAD